MHNIQDNKTEKKKLEGVIQIPIHAFTNAILSCYVHVVDFNAHSFIADLYKRTIFVRVLLEIIFTDTMKGYYLLRLSYEYIFCGHFPVMVQSNDLCMHWSPRKSNGSWYINLQKILQKESSWHKHNLTVLKHFLSLINDLENRYTWRKL
jgi:hypothetical protein